MLFGGHPQGFELPPPVSGGYGVFERPHPSPGQMTGGATSSRPSIFTKCGRLGPPWWGRSKTP
ncbi:hypothetical protein BN2537_11829 [Streptomyces venezuelae]|nr:hypothetical protein BN2537_11829 [Streptomyces venezuelae]